MVFILGRWAWDYFTTEPLKRALPDGAEVLYERRLSRPPDFSCYLKVDMDESSFREYCRRLGLTPHHPDRKYTDDTMWLSWDVLSEGRDEDWNPTPGMAGWYVKQVGDGWTFAKWENGTMYLKALTH